MQEALVMKSFSFISHELNTISPIMHHLLSDLGNNTIILLLEVSTILLESLLQYKIWTQKVYDVFFSTPHCEDAQKHVGGKLETLLSSEMVYTPVSSGCVVLTSLAQLSDSAPSWSDDV